MFEKILEDKALVRNLNKMGLNKPTEIQSKVITLIKEGKDIIGIAKTGSGKTAAFTLPLLELVNKDQRALILAPTRELAVQISNEIKKFDPTAYIAIIYGGVGYDKQIRDLIKAKIVIATPGRILDHIEQGNFKMNYIRYFVLDEADKMVNMGFIDDIKRIISKLPKQRQMLMFGATISRDIEGIANRFMKSPQTIRAESQVKEDYLEQYYYNIPRNKKFSLLLHLIRKNKGKRVIVFSSTIRYVDLIAKNLQKQHVKASMIHGKLTQSRRLNIVQDLHDHKINVLVASPVAARGLHFDGIDLVINYDLSQDPEEYIHRVGRTARAGKKGKAITLLSKESHSTFTRILQRYKLKITPLPDEPFENVRFNMGFEKPQRNRNFHSRRPRHQSRRAY
jgi:ATP-dependent RNA helicase DeaD